ncbi:rhomboid family intramembrane serine protease [Hymenobacter psoromatis]|nr:rhomboid family intramembrane serine protease [Hymenobacter psoromatis]
MSLTQDIREVFSRRDNALNQLLIINGIVFAILAVLYAISFLTQTFGWYSLIMRQIALPVDWATVIRHPWTVLTYAFVHQNPFHILFNMLNLYWFGQIIREYLGDRRLVSLYILGALAGAAFVLLAFNLLPIPHGYPEVIGASGAVTAIIVGAATLLPDYTFMLFIIGAVKIKWIAVAVVLISLATVGGNPGGEITHLGGALLGFIFIKQMKAGRDMGQPVVAVGSWFGRLFQGRPAMKVTHRSTVAAPRATASAAAGKSSPSATPPEEVDLILDKISRSGYESLSKDEKQKLFRASQQ